MPDFFPAKGSFHSLSRIGFSYYIHEVDESGDPRYYGYVDHRGAWIIMQQNRATGAHRYCAGKSDFSTNWTGRVGLSYDYFSNVV